MNKPKFKVGDKIRIITPSDEEYNKAGLSFNELKNWKDTTKFIVNKTGKIDYINALKTYKRIKIPVYNLTGLCDVLECELIRVGTHYND